MNTGQRLQAFIKFIAERESIRVKRWAGHAAPWTMDPILATYRFCNVQREYDRVTRWITRHWREPYAMHRDLWFALVVARLINHPPTLALLKLPGRWDAEQFRRVIDLRGDRGEKAYGSAYIVSTNGRSINKAKYLATKVLDPLWHARGRLRPTEGQTLQQYYELLREFNGMGGFIAAQVVADLKYVEPLRSAPDWWTFAASGPGSRRGLNRVLGLNVKESWNEQEWYETARVLADDLRPLLKAAGLPRLHLQDLQNCLCEYDKYERVRLKQGRPRQLFTPHQEDA